jgi:hypothetical protein
MPRILPPNPLDAVPLILVCIFAAVVGGGVAGLLVAAAVCP